jgi:hypothetical protein
VDAQQDGQMNWAEASLQPRFPFLSWHSAHFIDCLPLIVDNCGDHASATPLIDAEPAAEGDKGHKVSQERDPLIL